MRQWLESGRYQKSAAFERGRHWLPVLALFTAACTSVDAQQRQAPPAMPAQAATPVIAVPPVKLAGLPPTPQTPALQALVAAREASERKQWSVLGMLAPQARGDLLGNYPQYWLLRYQLWNPPANVPPKAEAARFLQENAGTYLGERLRSSWILAAARSGDAVSWFYLRLCAAGPGPAAQLTGKTQHLLHPRAEPHQALERLGRQALYLVEPAGGQFDEF